MGNVGGAEGNEVEKEERRKRGGREEEEGGGLTSIMFIWIHIGGNKCL